MELNSSTKTAKRTHSGSGRRKNSNTGAKENSNSRANQTLNMEVTKLTIDHSTLTSNDLHNFSTIVKPLCDNQEDRSLTGKTPAADKNSSEQYSSIFEKRNLS